MRAFALLLILTTVAFADSSTPTITIDSHSEIPTPWLTQEMNRVSWCTAMSWPGDSKTAPPPQRMTVTVHISGGAIKDALATSSSGNPDFDRRAVQCFKNLPPEFASHFLGDLDMVVPVYANNGAVALVSSLPAPPSPVPGRPIAAPASIGRPHSCLNEDLAGLRVGIGEIDDVMLAFTITDQGAVKNISVLNSSGNSMVDAAALQCASRWLYKPAMRDGAPTAVPWKAVVKIVWNPDNYDPAFVAVYTAAMPCALSSRNELPSQSPPPHTGLSMHISDGTITDFSVSSVSGNPNLDKRASDCFSKAAPDLVKDVKGSKWVEYYVRWK